MANVSCSYRSLFLNINPVMVNVYWQNTLLNSDCIMSRQKMKKLSSLSLVFTIESLLNPLVWKIWHSSVSSTV